MWSELIVKRHGRYVNVSVNHDKYQCYVSNPEGGTEYFPASSVGIKEAAIWARIWGYSYKTIKDLKDHWNSSIYEHTRAKQYDGPTTKTILVESK